MREVSEDEVVAMAGESECPVLAKEESEEMEAAVCLKAFPQGYVLGISDKVQDLHLWFTPELAVAEREDERYISIMRVCGSPYGQQS
jgi:hypothetical protein